ncbi:MAG: hypothetical protein Q9173_003256 [Seirophora scorigena]
MLRKQKEDHNPSGERENLDGSAVPSPTEADNKQHRRRTTSDRSNVNRTDASAVNEEPGEKKYSPRDEYANLDQLAAPSPVGSIEVERPQGFLEDQRAVPSRESPTSPQNDWGPEKNRVSRSLTELYTVSHLIFFSILGTLARLGVQALTFYPGAPVQTGVLWANVAGSLLIGFLIEDRKFFCEHVSSSATSLPSPSAQQAFKDEEQQKEQLRPLAPHKRTIPLYIGLATGFCGSLTSFSSFTRDAFLALANALPVPISHTSTSSIDPASTVPRNGGYSFMALLAVIITTVVLSISALLFGAQLALAVEWYTPSIPHLFARKFMDRGIVFLAWGSWLGAVLMAIWPPDRPGGPSYHGVQENWRGRVLFAIVFAPLGCLARYYLSLLLNAKIASFPSGTFAVNILGTAMEGMFWDLQHSPSSIGGGVLGCQVLQGMMDGFCGATTTVSTWAAELRGLKRRHAWVYGGASVSVGLGVMETAGADQAQREDMQESGLCAGTLEDTALTARCLTKSSLYYLGEKSGGQRGQGSKQQGHEHKNSKEALHLDLGISSWHASATGQGQTFVASTNHPSRARLHIVVWYAWLSVTVTFLAVRAFHPAMQKVLARLLIQRRLPALDRTVTIGASLMMLWVIALYAVIISIWWTRLHDYFVDRSDNGGIKHGGSRLAAVALTGHLCDVTMGMALVPISRHSALASFFQLSVSTTLTMHMLSAYTLFVLVLIHALLYLAWLPVFDNLSAQAQTVLPVLNPTYLDHETWPGNTTSLGIWRASLVFSGLLAIVIMLVISVTTLPRIRRRHFNLFYFTHLSSILMVIIICLHASTMLYCTAPGLVMWCLDWGMRLHELKSLLHGQISTFGNGWYCDSSRREVHPFTTITHLATIDAMTSPGSDEIVIQFLFRRVGAVATSVESPRQKSWISALITGGSKKAKKGGEWTGKLAGALDEKIIEQARAHSGGQELQLDISLDLALRLEGPYFSPADPSKYHTVVCLVAGTGISGAIAIAGAFSALQERCQSAASQPARSIPHGPVWRNCFVNWSVRENEYVDLPNIGQSLGVDFQINLTGPGRPRPDMKKIISDVRQSIPSDAGIWAYISGPKGFIENAKLVERSFAVPDPPRIKYYLVRFIAPDQHGKLGSSDSTITMKEGLVAFATLLSLAACALPHLNPIYRPLCWPPHSEIRPAVFAKCRRLAEEIPTSTIYEPDLPLKFSTDLSQRPDIKLPAIWGNGDDDCTVGLQFDPNRSGYDRTTLLDIRAAALAVAFHCVIRPPHLGGTVVVGWEKHMVVNVLSLADDSASSADGGNGTLASEKDAPGHHISADKQTALWDVRSFPKLTLFLVSLPIVLFTILTAAAPSNITTAGLSAGYECWRPPGVSLVYRDCVELIRRGLGLPHDPTVPMTFSRKNGAMILIPYAKTSPRGNCNVVLGIRGDTMATEVEKWENIKRVALEIALMCVIQEPHRGGSRYLDSSKVLTIMVPISLVRSSNESLRNLPPHLSSPTAVFTGATQGIGYATLRQLAIHTVTPTCYIVGRSGAKAQEIIDELKELNARGTYVFVKGEVALLESVDECCAKIKGMLGEGKALDLLYMSQGFLTLGGRNGSWDEMADGGNRDKGGNRYASVAAVLFEAETRLQSAHPMLTRQTSSQPILSLAPYPHVVSVLAGGKENTMVEDDLDLKHNYGVLTSAHHGTTMSSLAFEHLARQNPAVAFVHIYPGYVRTDILQSGFSWVRPFRCFSSLFILVQRLTMMWTNAQPVAFLFKYLVQPLLTFLEIPLADVGDRQLFHATSARYPPLSCSSTPEAQGAPLPRTVQVAEGIDGKKGSGAYLATQDSDVAPSGTGKLMTGYRERGVPEKVWGHTLEMFEKVRGS